MRSAVARKIFMTWGSVARPVEGACRVPHGGHSARLPGVQGNDNTHRPHDPEPSAVSAPRLFDVHEHHLEAIVDLNEANLSALGPMDDKKVSWFLQEAPYFRAMEVEGELAAFLIGLLPGSSYESLNYKWFDSNHEAFGYIDRIAVGGTHRRAGLGRKLYEDFTASLGPEIVRLAAEVNARPRNEISLAFHQRMGFREIGTLESPDGSKEVFLMLKDLS